VATSAESATTEPAELAVERPLPDKALLRLSGQWCIGQPRPGPDAAADVWTEGVRTLAFDTRGLRAWDSSLPVFLDQIAHRAAAQGVKVDPSGLPEGARRLLDLASAVPAASGAQGPSAQPSVIERIGQATLDFIRGAPDLIRFVGEAVLSLGRFVVGRAQYRSRDLWLIIQEVGPQALPIVSLLSFLIGLIMAYMGAVQLRRFGTEIYVANMVAIAMAREMGALMTAIIVAGRSGAAFAAQLGTMQVNEEIDALKTLGISPMDFLVLPRILALSLMVPLLALYADVVGILAGMLVGVTILDLGALEYYRQTVESLSLNHIVVGLIKASVYGVLVALAGCLRGIQSGRSAAAVGQATTSAVVTGIVFIITAGALLTVVYDILGV
jgi:phospholipid/cholesterol/gamma-HCH transport system permease protein